MFRLTAPRKIATGFALTLFLGALAASPSQAQDDSGWAFGLGVFDYQRTGTAALGMVEYRSEAFSIFGVRAFKAAGGIAATSDSAFYGYAGLRYDFELGGDWYLTPNFSVALYENGDGKDLGGPLQFRSGIELAYRFSNGRRLGLHFHHISNSRTYDLNPGEETLALVYSLGR